MNRKYILIVFLSLFVSSQVFSQLIGYNYYYNITINSSQVSGSGSHTDFPVLIDITSTNLRTVSNGGFVENNNGYDISFSNESNSATLQHDLEDYDPTTGRIRAWVKIPSLSTSSNTIIRVYFGNNAISSSTGSSSTWSSNYVSVWHLNDDFVDYATGANNGTNIGTSDISGKIADGQDFNSNSDKIDVGNFSVSGSALTISSWFKADDFDYDDGRIISKSTSSNESDHYFMLSTVASNGYKLRFRLKTNNSTSTLIASSGNLSASTWYYATAVYDGTNMKLYLNNTLVGSTSKSGTMNTNSAVDVFIGNNPGSEIKPFDGIIDEVRISNTARSSDWIATEYNNQSNPSGFYSISALQTVGGGGGSSSAITGYSDSCTITIDHSKVSGSSNLTDFPMYVEISSNSLKTVANGGSIQNSNGYDIAFGDEHNTQSLDYQVESYDATNGVLKAWVKIPVLYSASNTIIKMHYGKTGISASPSTSSVWDLNYKAVYHLNNSINDATSNSNNGTNNGSANVTGKLGDGRYFDGVNDYITASNSSSLNITGNKITLSAWVNAPVPNGDDSPFLHKASSVNQEQYMLGIDGSASTNNINTRVTTASGHYRHDSGQLPANTWTYVTFVYDGSLSSNQKKVYVNGVQVATHTATGNLISTTAPLQIAKRADSRYFEGNLDELRISDNARSVDWILTEYNNQNNPSTFYSISGCTTNGGGSGGGTGSSTTCGQKIDFVGQGATGLSSVTLPITNISNIDSIRAEIVWKGTKPSSVTFSSSTQTIVDNTTDYALYGGTGSGSFHAIMNPTSSITITPSNNTSSVHSASAYIYRSDTIYKASTQIYIQKAYQYRTTSNPPFSKTFTIDAVSGTRNITAIIPVSELNPDSRNVEVTITAGAYTKTVTAYKENLGDALRLFYVVLEDVPGNITSVTITVDSPDATGDSFVAGNIMIEIPCEGANGPIALKDSRTTKVDVPVNIYVPANDSDLDNDLDYSSVSVVGLEEPKNGSITNISSTGIITYLPNPEFVGVDSFEYRICDISGLCDVAWVYITVNDCGDGFVSSSTSGYATAVTSFYINPANSHSETNMNDALGAPDNDFALVHYNNDYMVLDLGVTVPSGEDIIIHWQKRSSESGTAKIVLSYSSNNSSFYSHPSYPSTTSTTTIATTVTLNQNARYIKILKSGSVSSVDFEIDAVQYLFGSGCIADSDRDGVADIYDIDDDNDGILDVVEGNGYDPGADQDNDGIVNYRDVDFSSFADGNNDGINDNFDFDLDGVPDYLDLDTDNDGILDNIEGQSTDDYIDIIYFDSDGDGLMDTYDANLGGASGSEGINPYDHDYEGLPDYKDDDSDEDGIADWIEAFDVNEDNLAYEELIILANYYFNKSRGINNNYNNDDVNSNGIPDWLEACNGAKGPTPGFLDPSCSCYYDSDGDGLVDLFDADSYGTTQLQPNLPEGEIDKDFRDDANENSTLPVELISFDVQAVENAEVIVSWTTASEINNEYFTLLRGLDTENTDVIQIISGAGNSNSPIKYSYTDVFPLKNTISYYELRQTDYDGTTKTIGIKAVELRENLYPISIEKWYQTDNRLFLQIYSVQNSPINIEIFNALGKLVYSETISSVSGAQHYQKDIVLPDLITNGIYLIRASNSTESTTQKLWISK